MAALKSVPFSWSFNSPTISGSLLSLRKSKCPLPPSGKSAWTKRLVSRWSLCRQLICDGEEELIDRSDAYKLTQNSHEPLGVEQGTEDLREQPFWLNHSPDHQRAKVHTFECSQVRKALARSASPSLKSVWLSFATQEEAVAEAVRREPDTHGVCRLCIGGCVTRSTYGGRR